MNILYICPEFLPSIGGIVTHVYNIAYRMKRHYGYKVVIYALDRARTSASLTEFIDGLEVRRFCSFAPNRCYYFSPEMLLFLRREAKTGSYDLVHVHSYTNFGPLAVYILTKLDLTKAKTVFTPHFHPQSTSQAREMLRKMYDLFLRKQIFSAFDTLVTLTGAEKNILSSFCNEQKISIIPNGINLEEFDHISESLFKDAHMPRNSPYILYVGYLLKYKGLDTMLFAFSKVLKELESDVKLVFVGDGTYRDRLQNMTNRLGLKRHVIFTGFIERKLLISAIKGCSIFVMPSSYEAFSISTVEAMACRKPVIVTRTGGLCELGIDDEFMVRYGDVHALSERIKYLLENNTIAESVGWKNYLVARRYSWDSVAKSHHELYKNILNS